MPSWAPGVAQPQLEILSRFATRDRATDFTQSSAEPQRLTRAERMLYLRATALLPTDCIVRDTARDIVQGAKSDEDKAARSTTGSLTTPSASPRRAAAASATSAACWRPATSR